MRGLAGRLGGRTFVDRTDAGRQLSEQVTPMRDLEDPIVLALPRGGVPVGLEVARALGAPLDVLVVRKLGHPLQPELAIGAIASGGAYVLNRRVLNEAPVSATEMERITERERIELERREKVYRGDAPPLTLTGRSVLLVDDGLATGSTMSAAVAAVRQLGPREVIVAVPVAPVETVRRLEREADRVVCLRTPAAFFAIGQAYASFLQLEDDEVVELLRRGESIGRMPGP
jgi:putative phosphoribosyl transferase